MDESTLRPAERRVLAAYREGLDTVPAIVAETRMPAGTVRSAWHRLRIRGLIQRPSERLPESRYSPSQRAVLTAMAPEERAILARWDTYRTEPRPTDLAHDLGIALTRITTGLAKLREAGLLPASKNRNASPETRDQRDPSEAEQKAIAARIAKIQPKAQRRYELARAAAIGWTVPHSCLQWEDD